VKSKKESEEEEEIPCSPLNSNKDKQTESEE
jgi:hypothetical protein